MVNKAQVVYQKWHKRRGGFAERAVFQFVDFRECLVLALVASQQLHENLKQCYLFIVFQLNSGIHLVSLIKGHAFRIGGFQQVAVV